METICLEHAGLRVRADALDFAVHKRGRRSFLRRSPSSWGAAGTRLERYSLSAADASVDGETTELWRRAENLGEGGRTEKCAELSNAMTASLFYKLG